MEGPRREDDARGMMIGGLIVLGVGLLFLLRNLNLIPDFDIVWPIFPIIVGLALIIAALAKGRKPAQS